MFPTSFEAVDVLLWEDVHHCLQGIWPVLGLWVLHPGLQQFVHHEPLSWIRLQAKREPFII